MGQSETLSLYTDGSGNLKGPIGWAFVLLAKGDQELCSAKGALPAGTSNIAELMAVTKGLEYCLEHYKDSSIVVYSDSAYVVNAWTEGWYDKWAQRKWKTARGRPVANQDYWVPLHNIVTQLKIEWVHINSHTGIHWNEVCDKMAGEARREFAGLPIKRIKKEKRK